MEEDVSCGVRGVLCVLGLSADGWLRCYKQQL